ncbi:hypothetical protein TgHK011_001450 [Trichoderma gracile]|nr:hypothetical protein TgHK011_001450 [Trichoderma gracile]
MSAHRQLPKSTGPRKAMNRNGLRFTDRHDPLASLSNAAEGNPRPTQRLQRIKILHVALLSEYDTLRWTARPEDTYLHTNRNASSLFRENALVYDLTSGISGEDIAKTLRWFLNVKAGSP